MVRRLLSCLEVFNLKLIVCFHVKLPSVLIGVFKIISFQKLACSTNGNTRLCVKRCLFRSEKGGFGAEKMQFQLKCLCFFLETFVGTALCL